MAMNKDILPVASGALSLGAALANLAAPTGTLAGLAKDLLKWLSRQGVDEDSFSRCAELAKGLAYPNAYGAQMRTSIISADEKLYALRNIPLGLVYSGALGRLMVRDPEFCYMVSTVACLTTSHDLDYAKAALTSMVLDRGGHQDGCKPKYHVQRAPIKAVISRVVESIYLNVTNAGHHSTPLPPVLEGLHSHLLDDTTFAGIVMQIQRTEARELLLQCDRFPGDLVLWLINHFEGKLMVHLANREIYQQALGTSSQILLLSIKQSCSEDNSLCENRDWPVQLTELHDTFPASGQIHRVLLKGSTDGDIRTCSFARQKFYSTDGLTTSYTANKTYLNRDARNHIESVAKKMLLWLLEREVADASEGTLQTELTGFSFKCHAELPARERAVRGLRLGDLLPRTPGLLQRNTGDPVGTAPIFRRPDWANSPMQSDNSDSEVWGTEATPEDIIKCFPAAQTMLEELQPKCHCSNCRVSGWLKDSKANCLRFAAVTELCILLSHAMADGSGAADVSGASEPGDAVSAIVTLFSEVMDQEILRWDTFFQVVTCTITGCSWDGFANANRDEGGTCWVSVQYGSLVVVAPWLDLKSDLKLKGSFAISMYEGNIQGVSDDLAMIVTEQETPAEEIDLNMINANSYAVDETTFSIRTATFRADAMLFRWMTILKAGPSFRVVDPGTLMNRLAHSVRPSCPHRTRAKDPIPPEMTSKFLLFNFSSILCSWSSRREA